MQARLESRTVPKSNAEQSRKSCVGQGRQDTICPSGFVRVIVDPLQVGVFRPDRGSIHELASYFASRENDASAHVVVNQNSGQKLIAYAAKAGKPSHRVSPCLNRTTVPRLSPELHVLIFGPCLVLERLTPALQKRLCSHP